MRANRIVALALFSLLASGLGVAQERPLPAPHIKAKLICHDCHQKEKPTSAAIPDEACMVCHGDYPAMRALTQAVKPNPHAPPKDPPHDPFACTDCHRQHQAPVVKCLDCHEGKFTFNMKK